jgi:diguanylate cyclase (GGDEF)-like protein
MKEIIQSEINKKLHENEIVININEPNKENEYDIKKCIILIVDDDKIITEIVMKYLLNNGYNNFILTSNSKIALESVYEHLPDLIICDYSMPNMRGDEFYDELKENPKFREIPFIFLSAITDENMIIERRKKGASAYLKKPIDEKILIITVEEQLKKYFKYLKISHFASMDELTGLNNRRVIITGLKHELAIRKYRDLALIFIDLDNFKEINDTYGHQAGDRILSEIGKIITVSIRSYDTAGRYGGDEFIVILPDTNLKQAMCVAETLRRTIINTKIKHEVAEMSVNASLGLASLKDNADYIEKILNIESLENIYEIKNANEVDWNKIEDYKVRISEILLKMADMSLYRAKQTVCNKCGFRSGKVHIFSDNKCPECNSDELLFGRNKVVVFE